MATTLMAPCWSCKVVGPCAPGCECSKCVDPENYAAWRRRYPNEHRAWVARQQRIAQAANRLRHVQIELGKAWADLMDAKDGIV